MSSGSYKRHDGFNPVQIKNGMVVRLNKNGSIRAVLGRQQGVTGDRKPTARQKSFKARHAKNIAKGKMSAAYWADKVKW